MDTRLFLIPFVLAVLAVTELDNRNFLYRNFKEEDLKGYHSPFYALVFCVIAFVALMFIFPSHNSEYKELKEQYDELSLSYESAQEDCESVQERYNDLSSAISESYDSALSVKAYFLGWDESSFEDAKESMKKLYDTLYPGEWED